MDEQKEEVKTYTQEELDEILKARGKKAGRKKLAESEKKNPKKTLRPDGTYEKHELTAKRKAVLERARAKLYEKRQAKKEAEKVHDTKVSIHKTSPSATEHHTEKPLLAYEVPSHQPIESSTKP